MSDIENNDSSDSDNDSTLSIKNIDRLPKTSPVYNTNTSPENDDIFDDMSDVDSENDSNILELMDKVDNDDYSIENDSDMGDDDDIEDRQTHKIKRDEIPNIDMDDEEEEEEDDEEDGENEDDDYFKKLDENVKKNIIADYHPEIHQHNYEEIEALSIVTRNEQGIIMDPLHKTIPILTKYEKARILGERARQINAGAKTFIVVDPVMIDGYLIALKELEQKKIPFIIKRPLPNGGIEYWKLKDLEFLS